jgi:hypothetical protein
MQSGPGEHLLIGAAKRQARRPTAIDRINNLKTGSTHPESIWGLRLV